MPKQSYECHESHESYESHGTCGPIGPKGRRKTRHPRLSSLLTSINPCCHRPKRNVRFALNFLPISFTPAFAQVLGRSALALMVAAPGVVCGQESTAVFDYNRVVQKASALAQQSFAPQPQELSPDMLNLDYDQYRRIRFLPDRSVWHDAAYRVGFFHPGYYFKRRVLFRSIEKERLRDIPFSPDYFHYDKPIVFSGHEGFVGFKTYVPSSVSGIQDEFMSFLGASYFRAIGHGMHWGLSSRGLAVNNGTNAPEEFPDFREFWIMEPKSSDQEFVFYALLDSESVTGGYEFKVHYGDTTTMDVRATLFIRKKVQVLEIAPLTTMFDFGENTVNKPTLKPDYQPTGKTDFSMNKTDFKRREFRPEVHDSDGLLMDTASGEKVWVPFDNPRSVVIRQFSNVHSFSVLQRDRDVNHYLDQEAEYHRRPNATVIPNGEFGPGYVRLLQFPTQDEYTDNTVTGWELQNPPEVGGKVEFAYRLLWRSDEPNRTQMRVVSTTVRPSPGSNETRFTVEYARPEIDQNIPVEELRPYIVANQGGQVKDVDFTPTSQGWLVSFTIFKPVPTQAMDISCVILRHDTFCSEKWLYLLNT
jgi:periplasmic glucans biosynthesis protein